MFVLVSSFFCSGVAVVVLWLGVVCGLVGGVVLAWFVFCVAVLVCCFWVVVWFGGGFSFCFCGLFSFFAGVVGLWLPVSCCGFVFYVCCVFVVFGSE